jgi:hypothetical protein
MAIKNVPKIEAPSYGGFVFGLDFSMSYSDAPSKLTYKVVSPSGTYINPTIGSDSSVRFGDFSFNGKVFSYEIEESVSGKVLSVTLVDNSVILDKKYVVVFRPGIFGKMGSSKNVDLPVVFTSEDEYYDLADTGSGYKLVKKNFTNSSVTRSVRYYNGTVGDIIIVGSEEPPDTACEVAATSYTFSDLKSTAGVSGITSCPITDSLVRKTYEGTLRSVLNSWCQDFGVSFYWDYSNNKLVFFDLKNPVFSIPTSIQDPSITSKKLSYSAEGKYNQLAANYFIKPYTPKATNLSKSNSRQSSISLPCLSFSRFLKAGSDDDNGLYGGTRTQSEFITSAVCGYLSPVLRAFYNFSLLNGKLGPHCGLTSSNKVVLNAGAVAAGLTTSCYGEQMNNMAAFSNCEVDDLGKDWHCYLVNYDEGVEKKWEEIEQDIFTSKIGNFYRGPGTRSGESYFCSATSIITMSISVEPEGTRYEDADSMEDSSLKGRRIFERGGAGPSVPAAQALQQLGIEDSAQYIVNLMPTKHNISEASSVAESLISYAIISKSQASSYNTIMFVPKSSHLNNWMSFSASYTTGANDREQTVSDIESSQQAGNKCTLTDLNEKKCLSAKEQVMDRQRSSNSDNDGDTQVITGPLSKIGRGATIRAHGSSVKIVSSSESSYRGCITTSYSAEVLVDETQKEEIVFQFDGNTSPNDSLVSTRFILENRSISENLVKEKPTPSELFSRDSYLQDNNVSMVNYTCSDFVSSLPISVSKGLNNLDITISDDGFSATYSYSTRPPVFGNQDLSRVVIGNNPSPAAFQIR